MNNAPTAYKANTRSIDLPITSTVNSNDPEYKVLSELHYQNDALSHIFDLLFNALSNNVWEMLDLDVVEAQCNNAVRFMKISKRFNRLHNLSNKTLTYSEEGGFGLNGHNFETLDEIEKAIANKAFL